MSQDDIKINVNSHNVSLIYAPLVNLQRTVKQNCLFGGFILIIMFITTISIVNDLYQRIQYNSWTTINTGLVCLAILCIGIIVFIGSKIKKDLKNLKMVKKIVKDTENFLNNLPGKENDSIFKQLEYLGIDPSQDIEESQ